MRPLRRGSQRDELEHDTMLRFPEGACMRSNAAAPRAFIQALGMIKVAAAQAKTMRGHWRSCS